jgi:hypothetical protein
MSFVGFILELAVAVLLGFTVVYCLRLDRKLQLLRADETAMRQTVVDLGLATDRAERAIESLRQSLAECDARLGEKLKAAEATSADLLDTIQSGDEVLNRIGRIVNTARHAVSEAETRLQAPINGNVSDTIAAAEAFAARARRRILDNAA